MSAEPTSHALGITSSMVNRRFATRHQLGGLGWCGVTADSHGWIACRLRIGKLAL